MANKHAETARRLSERVKDLTQEVESRQHELDELRSWIASKGNALADVETAGEHLLGDAVRINRESRIAVDTLSDVALEAWEAFSQKIADLRDAAQVDVGNIKNAISAALPFDGKVQLNPTERRLRKENEDLRSKVDSMASDLGNATSTVSELRARLRVSEDALPKFLRNRVRSMVKGTNYTLERLATMKVTKRPGPESELAGLGRYLCAKLWEQQQSAKMKAAIDSDDLFEEEEEPEPELEAAG
jgi:cell division septum initiation protein DivIVA